MANPHSPTDASPAQLRELLGAAMRAHQSGELYDADLLYAEALRIEPDNLKALRLRGILARERGDLDTALALLRHAQQVAPGDAEPLNEIALTQMAAGELQAAEHSLRQAVAANADSTRTVVNLGALLQHRGHLQAAIDCYREALAREPSDLHLQCNLAKALADAGKTKEALELCAAAIEQSNGHPAALATRGAVLIDARDYAAARAALAEATRLDPADDMALVNLALSHSVLGDRHAAATALQQALDVNPFNARAVADLSDCLCALGDAPAALDLCTSFLQQHSGERLVVAAHALALHNAGQHAAARDLTDYATLVRVIDLPCPDGFSGPDEFHSALATVIRTDASLLDNPVSKSTYGGAQTGELDLDHNDTLRAFATAIRKAVQMATREWQAAGLQEHPLLAAAAPEGFVRAWGTVLRAGGQQTPHMHPLGWLSGVYYVQLPTAMSAQNPNAGWLEFGQPPERFYCKTLPATQRVEPVAGRLILFPSWLWHRTLPFTAGGERISVAFDVMPRAALRLL